MAEPKEGVDFEWVKAKNGNYYSRKFFTSAEKKARAEASKPAAKPKATPKKPKEKPVTKDGMKGYRAGDVTVTTLGKGVSGTRPTPKPQAASKPSPRASTGGPARYPTSKPQAASKPSPRASTPKAKLKEGFTSPGQVKDGRQAKPTSTPEYRASRMTTAMKGIPSGMNFTEWERYMKRAGKHSWKPNEALTEYQKYKKAKK